MSDREDEIRLGFMIRDGLSEHLSKKDLNPLIGFVVTGLAMFILAALPLVLT